jgi:hypothetical protein
MLKIFSINCQLRNKLFIIHRFSLVKAAMSAPHLDKECLTSICTGAMYETPPLLNFPIAKGGTKTIAHI